MSECLKVLLNMYQKIGSLHKVVTKFIHFRHKMSKKPSKYEKKLSKVNNLLQISINGNLTIVNLTCPMK